MERATRAIELSECTVKIITFLTWGEKELVQSALVSGADIGQEGFKGFDNSALLVATYKLLEIGVKEITQKDGTIVKYTNEWMSNLSMEDGDKLYLAINELQGKKK